MKVPSLPLLTLLLASTNAQQACPFLADAPPIEYELPPMSLSHPRTDLPISFQGITPVISRKPLPFGATPRVTLMKYSSEPVVEYDGVTDTMTIKSAGCSAHGGDSGAVLSKDASRLWWTTLVASTTLGLADARLRPAVLGFLSLVALHGVSAQDDECMPAVQLVVEAPQSYQGAVELCEEEINDPAVCPLPFPTFDTCEDATPQCKLVVVGGGAGGLYSAMRLMDEGVYQGEDICIFEMTERVGGRLFSLRGLGPDNDLSVDAGGYRTWPRFTPTLHALITEYLGIDMECYDDADPCTRFNIVDETGNKSGFATFIEAMMQKLVDGGACFYPYHELTSIFKMDENGDIAISRQTTTVGEPFHGHELHFANGVKATASDATILGIPQRPLMNVVRQSNFDMTGILDLPKLDAMHSVQTVIATKLYLYYPRGHVFWYKLGLRSGEFEMTGDARSMLLGGRYHDGHVRCDDPDDLDTCHGFLLAVYVNDLSGNKAQYFRRFQRDRPEPVTIIANKDLEGRQFLQHAHDQLELYHLYENPDPSYNGFEANQVFTETSAPEFAVLSTWNVAVPWAGAAWHTWTDLDNVPTALDLFGEHNIFVVNEAFSLLHGWAEGSIKLGDQILQNYFGVERPWDFDVVDINQIVSQSSSRECDGVVPDEDTTVSSGGSGGGGVSSGGSTDDDPFCFTQDALVTMVDGSFKRIIDVQTNDLVKTMSGMGLVTAKLVHPVGRTVQVALVDTGDFKKDTVLVGTPSHPVFVNDKWQELGKLLEKDNEDLSIALTTQQVDAFYNLEIDGNDLTEASSHSYEVNGVVASGLGNHPDLNQRFARQAAFQQ